MWCVFVCVCVRTILQHKVFDFWQDCTKGSMYVSIFSVLQVSSRKKYNLNGRFFAQHAGFIWYHEATEQKLKHNVAEEQSLNWVTAVNFGRWAPRTPWREESWWENENLTHCNCKNVGQQCEIEKILAKSTVNPPWSDHLPTSIQLSNVVYLQSHSIFFISCN